MKTFAVSLFLALFLGAGAMACPTYSVHAPIYSVSGPQLWQPHSFTVTAGGDYNIGYCGGVRPATDRGQGFFTSRPDFTFDLYQMSGYELVLSVRSACDSALLVNTGAANWFYDDDDNGNLDARITLTRPSNGILDVWVGTYDGAYCDATLTLETF